MSNYQDTVEPLTQTKYTTEEVTAVNDILPGAEVEVEVDFEGLDDDTGVKKGKGEEENDKNAF